MSPQDFAEVRVQVDGLRASRYLDGPSGADWILRNDLIDKRETNMYVDYVRHGPQP
jgi:hypothetical protein